jgi:hypothetical protein
MSLKSMDCLPITELHLSSVYDVSWSKRIRETAHEVDRAIGLEQDIYQIDAGWTAMEARRTAVREVDTETVKFAVCLE